MSETIHQQHRSRVEELRRMRVSDIHSNDSPERIVMTAISDQRPDLAFEERKRLTKEVILAPRGKEIKIGEKNIPVEDLQFRIANSIETLNCETSSVNEYFTWIDEGRHIIKDMNDGFVEPQELEHKHNFLGHLEQREAELMTCLGLYQASASPQAKERYQELQQKLTKLREIKGSVNSSTKDTADRKNTREEYEKALLYYNAVKNLTVISIAEKKKLGIYQEKEEDFQRDMQRKYMLSHHSPAEDFLHQRPKEVSKNDIAKRIELLRGRKSMDEVLKEQENKRKEIRTRAFSQEEFEKMMRQKEERENVSRRA